MQLVNRTFSPTYNCAAVDQFGLFCGRFGRSETPENVSCIPVTLSSTSHFILAITDCLPGKGKVQVLQELIEQVLYNSKVVKFIYRL